MVIPQRKLQPEEFLSESEKGGLVVDVRAPSEYAEGHITGAVSWPLFSDEERAVIGTLYKQQSRDDAVLMGLEIIGPKMKEMAEYGRKLYAENDNKPLLVYCWRGGMRSQSVGWLLRTAGVPAFIMDGGYKAFRSFAREQFDRPLNLVVLGGYTGAAKTEVLTELAKLQGEDVVDLEGMAKHYGSAFGNLEGHVQPTSRQFSNDLYFRLRELNAWGDKGERARPIWIENESRKIGKVDMPEPVFSQLIDSPCFEMQRTLDDRTTHLVKMYGKIDRQLLADAFVKITPKLGGQHVKEAIESLEKNDLKRAAEIALVYYDKTYNHGLTKRPNSNRVEVDLRGKTPQESALYLSDFLTKYLQN